MRYELNFQMEPFAGYAESGRQDSFEAEAGLDSEYQDGILRFEPEMEESLFDAASEFEDESAGVSALFFKPLSKAFASGNALWNTVASAATSSDDKLFKRVRNRGWARYGGGRVDARLKQLRDSGRLSISDADIDMLQRVANVETGGSIQGINSWDSAYMSVGFMQWPIMYSKDGKLQRLIQRSPASFRKYGIELDAPRRYTIKSGKQTYTPIAIKGAQTVSDLRSLEWAKRFYAAGLDPDVIVAEVKLALEVIEESKKILVNKAGRYFLPHYEKSPVLRALIQETYNNRPAYMVTALKRATARAQPSGEVSTDKFLDLVRVAIREVYKEKEPEGGPKKAENLIHKTNRLVL